ncbi:peptidoglycan editing factor PgeF [Fodinibius salsisoli]|uniref:Purine nucleoside phosphorylase n=1 Tax=Fodinibius salsisoli TaxID=2820877 RepID=A0ABT3PMQ1_9BACT|nr:peptidoglycan editing factor PgeF [Fodinibius salsisoli]MCW9707224.1 peptidoglycan editing factor PgeF [Fodinibius salsisoli]
MSSSSTKLSLIQPSMLDQDESINIWFTFKNEHHYFPESRINGLNLGFNTLDSEAAVTQNRSLLLSELNLDSEWVAYADQVHSNRVQVVSEGGTYSSTDGLVTTLPGLTLAIQVADCAAVLIWDPINYVIGAFHAGWRGTVSDIVPRGIALMLQQGAKREQLRAFISPCISLQNFEVGPEVAEQFPDKYVDWDSYTKPHVNLKGFLHTQLVDEGLNEESIEIHPACTIENAQKFYSYRREGERSGRMMGIIQISR